jgi:hypothetical protein
LSAAVAFSGAAGAQNQPASGVPARDAADPSQGFIVAIPATNGAAAGRIAEEPAVQRMPPTVVRGYRDTQAQVPCDRTQSTGQEACRRAELAAKYAEMDKLCRTLSSAEFPTCIKSAYSAD